MVALIWEPLVKQIRYTHCDTYQEAVLILLTQDHAKLVSWECSQANTGYIVATEEEQDA